MTLFACKSILGNNTKKKFVPDQPLKRAFMLIQILLFILIFYWYNICFQHTNVKDLSQTVNKKLQENVCIGMFVILKF